MPDSEERLTTLLQAAYAAGRRAAVFDGIRSAGEGARQQGRTAPAGRESPKDRTGEEWHH